MGLMDMVNPDIPLYIGKASKEILKRLNNRTRKFPVELVERIRTFEAPQTIVIGDIAITPLFVDHSAYDAHMFLIEADGKRVLHTGDFRNHGFRGKGLLPTLRKYVGKVDALICEGTTLNRPDCRNVNKAFPASELQTPLRSLSGSKTIKKKHIVPPWLEVQCAFYIVFIRSSSSRFCSSDKVRCFEKSISCSVLVVFT